MTVLRKGISDAELTSLLSEAIEKKPFEHNFEKKIKEEDNLEKREMFKIGG